MREDFKQQMEEELKYVDVTLTDRQIEQFYRYYELLNEWNQVMNLTAITEMKEVVTKHFGLKESDRRPGERGDFCGRCGNRSRISRHSLKDCISRLKGNAVRLSE
jgi:hypothetical protein